MKATQRHAHLEGQRFGQLTVTGFSHISERGAAVWHARCDCGATVTGLTEQFRRYLRSCVPCKRKADLPTRFWAKVNKTETCWLWTGATDRHGYGQITILGKHRPAHCVAYELLVGPIPAGMELDHYKCWTPACVNPGHLRPATHRQNSDNRKGAQANSTTGIRGVTRSPHAWIAQYHTDGRHIYLGSYRTAAEAEAAVVTFRESVN